MTEEPKATRIFMTDKQIAHAYRLIDMYLVEDGEFYSYTLNWSDERIAEEVSTATHPLSVHHIRPRRERDYGPLRPQYVKGSIEEQVDSLRDLMVAQNDLLKEQSRQVDEIDQSVDVVRARLEEVESMLGSMKTVADKHRKELEAVFDKKLEQARAAFKAIRDGKDEEAQ